MEKTFETPRPISLYVELGAGSLAVAATEVTQTTVEVSGKDAEEVTVEQRGEQITVIAPQRRSGFFGGGHNEYRVHVTMPSGSAIASKLGSADVSVTGRVGETSLRAGSGDVRMEEVTDNADIQTGSGDVQVDSVGGDLRVKAGSGDVQLGQVHGDASVSTGSGDVTITYTAGSVEVKSGSGDIQLRDAHEDVSLSTASGDLTVRTLHRGRLRANNVSGDIEVGVPSGVPVWTDITTMTGDVSSNLVGAGQPVDDQDYIELRARTVSGDIHLEQL